MSVLAGAFIIWLISHSKHQKKLKPFLTLIAVALRMNSVRFEHNTFEFIENMICIYSANFSGILFEKKNAPKSNQYLAREFLSDSIEMFIFFVLCGQVNMFRSVCA